MMTSERICNEAKRLPAELASVALDFILSLERQHVLQQQAKQAGSEPVDLPSLDTRGWHFDREEANCATLYTEDMQHGQVIDGGLTILNPFKV
ncbi:MAG: hypothetical protein H7838_08995 [Magnetococcus sp. DMHC-8]